jgi:hypothetical protein
MARPTIFDPPMTAAERMQRYRERKRHPLPEPDTITEALRRTTPKNRARYVGRSVRSLHYIGVFLRCQEIKWDDAILDGKYGRCGIAFLAEVCKYSNAAGQQAVRDCIREHRSAAAGRALWRRLVFLSHLYRPLPDGIRVWRPRYPTR